MLSGIPASNSNTRERITLHVLTSVAGRLFNEQTKKFESEHKDKATIKKKKKKDASANATTQVVPTSIVLPTSEVDKPTQQQKTTVDTTKVRKTASTSPSKKRRAVDETPSKEAVSPKKPKSPETTRKDKSSEKKKSKDKKEKKKPKDKKSSKSKQPQEKSPSSSQINHLPLSVVTPISTPAAVPATTVTVTQTTAPQAVSTPLPKYDPSYNREAWLKQQKEEYGISDEPISSSQSSMEILPIPSITTLVQPTAVPKPIGEEIAPQVEFSGHIIPDVPKATEQPSLLVGASRSEVDAFGFLEDTTLELPSELVVGNTAFRLDDDMGVMSCEPLVNSNFDTSSQHTEIVHTMEQLMGDPQQILDNIPPESSQNLREQNLLLHRQLKAQEDTIQAHQVRELHLKTLYETLRSKYEPTVERLHHLLHYTSQAKQVENELLKEKEELEEQIKNYKAQVADLTARLESVAGPCVDIVLGFKQFHDSGAVASLQGVARNIPFLATLLTGLSEALTTFDRAFNKNCSETGLFEGIEQIKKVQTPASRQQLTLLPPQ